jgi:hypothetical protein
MIKHKTFLIFDQFSAWEKQHLAQFLQSPFFNKQPKMLQVFDFLNQKDHKDWQHSDFKKQLFDQIYPGEPYKDTQVRLLLSDFGKLLDRFLAVSAFQKDTFAFDKQVLQAYRERELRSLYQPALKKLQKSLEAKPFKNINYYLEKHQMEELEYANAVLFQNRQSSDSLQALSNNLDHFYLAKKLRYACEMINRQHIFQESFKLGLLEEIRAFIATERYQSVPAIQVYRNILQTLEEPDEESHFFALKETLKKDSTLFTLDENKVLYGFAQNYCVRKINKGKPEYLAEIFELYQLSLAHQVIFQGEYLSQFDYKNIVTVGLRLNEITWTEQFIKEYKASLNPEVRENAYNYNLANLAFYQQDMKKAMRLLLQVEFTDIFYNLDARSLLMKSYYELEEYEALFAFEKTFKNYLRRNKQLSALQKTAYRNLITFTGKLAKLRLKRHKPDESLRSQIQKTAQIADKSWLRRKLDEF